MKKHFGRDLMKRVRILSSVCLVCVLTALCLFALPVKADAGSWGGFSYTVTNGEATITGCSVSTAAVNVPSSIEGYPVTAIGELAFYQVKTLQSLTIPASVKSIHSSGIASCDNLTGIWVDSGNPIYSSDASGALLSKDKKILYQLPLGVSGSYTIPASVTTVVKKAISGNDNLTELIIGDGVTTIEEYSMSSCGKLKTITIGNGLTAIPQNAFSYCGSLTTVSIGNGVKEISRWAFRECSALTTVRIGDGVQSISKEAFQSCYNLADITVSGNNPYYSTDSDSVLFDKDKTVLIQSFKKLSGSYTVPDSVTTIRSMAFAGQTNLTQVNFGRNVEIVEDYAFQHCSGLTDVYISETIRSVDNSTFYGCSNLKYNTYDNATYLGNEQKPYLVLMDTTNTGITELTIHSQTKVLADYSVRCCTALKQIAVPDGVVTVGYNAFEECSALKSVTLGSSVTTIEEYAFYKCTALETINFPATTNYIGDYAFRECKALKDIYISDPNSWCMLQSGQIDEYGGIIGHGAALHVLDTNGQEMTEVVFSSDVTVIPHCAFRNSTLTSVRIPASVKSIGVHAFGGSVDLKTVTMAEGVTLIDTCAFYECAALEDITIPDSVTELENQVFAECSNLRHAVIGDGVIDMYPDMFSGCDNLTSVVIGDSVKCIYANTFYGLEKLTSVTIGNSVTSIGDEAFSYCNSLQTVVIPDSVTSIGEWAFSYCHGIENFVVGKGLTSVGCFCFAFCDVEHVNVFVTDANAWCKIPRADGANFFGGLKTVYVVDQEGELVTDLVLDSSVTVIPELAFVNSPLNSVTIPGSVKEIGEYAFSGCSNLSKVHIRNGLKVLGCGAFYFCESLKEIAIPDSAIAIEALAFYGCNALQSITIGKNVLSIGSSVFVGCNNLETAYVSKENRYYKNDDAGALLDAAGTWLIRCPKYVDGHYRIPDGVTTIDGGAFNGCYGLHSLYIPASVVTVEGLPANSCLYLRCTYYGGSEEQWSDIDIYPDARNMFYNVIYDIADTDGWIKKDGKWYFYQDGVMQTGWYRELGGYHYYLDETGAMVADTTRVIDGEECVFDEYGVLQYKVLRNGWLEDGGNRYYLEDGNKVTGWKTIEEVRYYFNSQGVMQTGWLQLGDDRYYLDETGAMVTGTVTIEGKQHTFDSSGVWLGEAVQNGWSLEGGKWYYYKNNTKVTGWLKDSGYWYYFDANGIMQTGWRQVGKIWYYFKTGGNMATGWAKVGSVYYYFDSNGAMQTGWIKDGGVWYYMKSSGAMQTGWLKQGSTWYYFHSSGAMATGSVKIGTKTYRFNASGVCLNP